MKRPIIWTGSVDCGGSANATITLPSGMTIVELYMLLACGSNASFELQVNSAGNTHADQRVMALETGSSDFTNGNSISGWRFGSNGNRTGNYTYGRWVIAVVGTGQVVAINRCEDTHSAPGQYLCEQGFHVETTQSDLTSLTVKTTVGTFASNSRMVAVAYRFVD